MKTRDRGPSLIGVHRRAAEWPADRAETYPFAVPAVRSMTRLDLEVPVTFLVGENGSGKSTLLEAIAVASEVPAAGNDQSGTDSSLTHARTLAGCLRLVWRRRSRAGMFMRAEDFFGYLRRQARDDARILREDREARCGLPAVTIDPGDVDHPDEIEAKRHLETRDQRSHGESFLDLFATRIRRPGLFLLDEPETPLSPKRQLALLSLMLDAVDQGAQFLVATHSPILLALPGAQILSCDETPLKRVSYSDLEQVNFTREFLNSPDRFLKRVRDA